MFIDYAQRFLLEGFPLDEQFHTLLSSTSHANIARHTNVIYIQLKAGSLICLEYKWSHENFRPWGHRLPIACHSCNALRPYGKHVKPKIGTTLTFLCRNPECDGCISFSKPDGIEVINSDAGGNWLIECHSL
jgi:hypothetical protein